MEQQSFLTHRKALVVMCIAVLLLAQQQAHAGPLVSRVQSSSDQIPDLRGEHIGHMLKRTARMTPLWRIMSSKPSGAFCQNNFECATGLCREGRCSTNQHPSSEPVKY